MTPAAPSDSGNSPPRDWSLLLATALGPLGWPSDVRAASLHLHGDEHAHASPHRLTLAITLALAAWGHATETLGRRRTLRPQTLKMLLPDAARFFFPEHTWAPRLAGSPLPVGSRNGVPLLSAILPTADGRYFVPSALAPAQVAAWAHALNCRAHAADLAGAVRAQTAKTLESLADAHRLPGAICRSASQWAQHPQGRTLAQMPIIAQQPLTGARLEMPNASRSLGQRALSGIRILCFGRVFAGPIAARLLAEQGAEVLFIKSPSDREARAVWLEGHVGGRACALDLRQASDRQVARRLLHSSHVVIDNLRPGALSDMGLWPLSPAKGPVPHLVQISAWGPSGPKRLAVGYDMNVQAATGILSAEAQSGPPQFGPTLLVADFLAAAWAAAAAVAALLRPPDSPPIASHVSLAKCLMWLQSLGPRAAVTASRCPLPAAIDVRTPWGLMRRLAPVVRFSEAPSYWPALGVPAPASAAPHWPRPGL